MALKTNTKKARQNVRDYIKEWASDYLSDNYGYSEEEVENNIYGLLWDVFKREKLDRNELYKACKVSTFTIFQEWASGLAVGGLFCYYYNRNAADDLGSILEETEEEKARFTEEQAENMLTRLIYREIEEGRR